MNKKQADQLEQYAIIKLIQAGFLLREGKRYDYYRTGNLGKVGVTIRIEYNKNISIKGGYTQTPQWFFLMGKFYEPKKALKAGIKCSKFFGIYNSPVIDTEKTIDFMIGQYTK